MSSFVQSFDQLILKPLEALVLSVAHEEVTEHPDWNSSLKGSWYLSPKQHAMEFVLFNIVIAWAYTYYNRRAALTSAGYQKLSLAATASANRKQSSIVKALDNIIFAVLLFTNIANFIYKYLKDTWWFLLQPCHINLMILNYLFLPSFRSGQGSPRKQERNTWIFNLVLHLNWGAILAILTPDYRDQVHPFEFEFFWLEHLVLLFVPLYCFAVDRYYVFPLDMNFATMAFFVKAGFHSFLLASAAIVTNNNLNYIMTPPVGILQRFGEFYRLAMYAACYPITLLTRYFIWEPVYQGIRMLKGGSFFDEALKSQAQQKSEKSLKADTVKKNKL
ncbi:hypothetical protein MP638_002952 [Amoeboaphelidium occidentale]|nr:hypothetical protein MP638_002952 [Amoeboaphelidium occidentale]